MQHCAYESQFPSRLIRNLGSLRRRKESGALKEREVSEALKEEKRTIFFFYTLLCLSQYNSISCLRTCFSLTF